MYDTSVMNMHQTGTKYVEMGEAVWADSSTQSTTRHTNGMQKAKCIFLTLTCNEVKMKGVLHINNDCVIDWYKVCVNI